MDSPASTDHLEQLNNNIVSLNDNITQLNNVIQALSSKTGIIEGLAALNDNLIRQNKKVEAKAPPMAERSSRSDGEPISITFTKTDLGYSLYGRTFDLKDIIKSEGNGTWNSENKTWSILESGKQPLVDALNKMTNINVIFS